MGLTTEELESRIADLQKAGLMNGNQLAVAAITLTLFLPCIAQVLIILD